VGRMPFLSPNQQHQGTEALIRGLLTIYNSHKNATILDVLNFSNWRVAAPGDVDPPLTEDSITSGSCKVKAVLTVK